MKVDLPGSVLFNTRLLPCTIESALWVCKTGPARESRSICVHPEIFFEVEVAYLQFQNYLKALEGRI